MALPFRVSEAIRDFQRYVASQHGQRAERWRLARALIQRVAEEFSKLAMNSDGPPVRPEQVGDLLNIRFKYSKTDDSKGCGSMVPVGDGFEALVFGDPSTPRARFTVAHECGHALGLAHGAGGGVMGTGCGPGCVTRNIYPDDINGILALYGPYTNEGIWSSTDLKRE